MTCQNSLDIEASVNVSVVKNAEICLQSKVWARMLADQVGEVMGDYLV
jgi:hypothetical protein